MNSFSLYFILHTMFVQVHYTTLPYQNPKYFQDLSLCLFCEGDCNLSLPHQSADLFSHGISASLYSHLPHIGTTLGCSFKHAFLGQIGAPSLSVPFYLFFTPNSVAFSWPHISLPQRVVLSSVFSICNVLGRLLRLPYICINDSVNANKNECKMTRGIHTVSFHCR